MFMINRKLSYKKGMWKLKIDEKLECPKCKGSHFTVRREATYLYTYNLDTPDTELWSEHDEKLSFLFDNREQINNKEYLKCEQCGAQFPCDFDRQDDIQFTILQKAVRADHQVNPEFLG